MQTAISGLLFFCILICISSCKKEEPLDTLASQLVESIKKKDAGAYYALFPDSKYVAKYGIFAYGLYSPRSDEEMAFWRRPYSQFEKSVDSLEKLTKPDVITKINGMFDDFHSTALWDSIAIESIDTTHTRIRETGDRVNNKRVKKIYTDMIIHLKVKNEKYDLKCRDVVKSEDKGWFLREASSRVELEKIN
jgi:hypothetical protein